MYPMLKQNHFTVVFKLLGTFRMVIDGQPEVAFDLLSRKHFIEKLVFWCYKSDHLGVRYVDIFKLNNSFLQLSF